MTQPLGMGANTALDSTTGEVRITHRADPQLDVNLTAFLVTGDGKVRTDADMVFFNQPQGENGAAVYHPPAPGGAGVEHRLSFDLGRLPAGVEKIVVCLTEDAGGGFAQVAGLEARIDGQVELTPVPPFSSEKGLIVCEVYVRGGQAKVRAVWQGFASGLAGLATDHGVAVDDEPAAASPPPPPPAPPAQASPPPPPPPAPAAAPASAGPQFSSGDPLRQGPPPPAPPLPLTSGDPLTG